MLNNSQIQAANPNHSVWVGASAGTGKTKILTDRVLRLLLEGNEPSKILCLTFTNAAASEMLERVNREISRWTEVTKEELQEILFKLFGEKPADEIVDLAQGLFHQLFANHENVKIQTIHSFCQSLLKRFSLEAGLNVGFKLADDNQQNLLLNQAQEQSLLNKNILDSIDKIAAELHFIQLPEIFKNIAGQRDKIALILDHHEGAKNLLHKLAEQIGGKLPYRLEEDLFREYQLVDRALLEKLFSVSQESDGMNDARKVPYIEEALSLDKLTMESLTRYRKIFLDSKGQVPIRLFKKQYDQELEEFSLLISQEQEKLQTLSNDIAINKTLELTEALLIIAEEFLTNYALLKEQEGVFDYADLIIKTIELLENSAAQEWILYKLEGGIDHILIDEAQDTSIWHWQIIYKLLEEFFAGEGASEENKTIFVVGDDKQSIFSFQGAEHSLFAQVRKLLADKTQQVEKTWCDINLDISYRSVPPILDLVNELCKLPQVQNSFADFATQHNAHRIEAKGLVEIWPLVEQQKENIERVPWQFPEKRISKHNANSELAENIADKIADWLENKRVIAAQERPVRAGDIMILLRKRGDLRNFIIKALHKRHIPVAAEDKINLLENIAVQDLLALAKFITLPHDDLNLACLLKSPLIALSETELFEICYERGDKSIWENIADTKLHTQLNELILLSKSKTVYEYFSYILDVKAGRQKFIARLGDDVNKILNLFLEEIMIFIENEIPTFDNFACYFTKRKSEIKADMESGVDAVRIMTIHASKGLQAPIVILPDTTSKTKTYSNNILFSDDDDKMLMWVARKEYREEYAESLHNKHKLKENAESMRLLYVALTRAEDELYIGGVQGSKNDKNWYKIITEAVRDIAVQQDDNLIITNYHDEVLAKEIANDAEEEEITLPAYLHEKLNLSDEQEYATASSSKNTENNYTTKKGELVHYVLEHIKTSADIEQILSQKGEFLKKGEKEIIAQQLSAVMDEFVGLFAYDAKCEVQISGEVSGRLVVGQIDRLVFMQDKILILDYKSDSTVPKNISEISQEYLQQLALYKKLIEQIYPNKEIKTALLYTVAAKYFETGA
jgi:ATP-dependent helicase/nuclease subunit A